MNTLNSTTSQHNPSKNKEGYSQLSLRNQDPDFKTSNPHIFPSLHPLSNFYRERNMNQPSIPIQARPSLAYEPVTIKKVKQNDNSEKVLQNIQQINFPQSPIKEEARDLIKIENKEAQDLSHNSNYKELKSPKKSSRLLKTYKKKINEEDLKSIQSYQNEVCRIKDPLVIPDNIFKESKVLQKQKINLDSRGSIRNSEICKSKQNPQLAIANLEKEKVIYSPENQRTIFPIPNINILNVQSIYNGLQMEYLSLQLKQLAPSLFEICQQNQEKLSANLKESSLNKQKLGSFDIASDLSDESSDEIDENAQEQNIKQEIQC